MVRIVEDEPDVAETYTPWLQQEYEVRMAQNGDEGLEQLTRMSMWCYSTG